MDEWASPPFALYGYLWTGCGRGKRGVNSLYGKMIFKKKLNIKPPYNKFYTPFAVHIDHILTLLYI